MTKLKIENTYILGLFGKPSVFTKINLKKPLFRSSHFEIYFRLECRRNRGSRQNFYETLFSKDRMLIKPDHYVTHKLITITYLSKKNEQFKSYMDIKIQTQKLINLYPKI